MKKSISIILSIFFSLLMLKADAVIVPGKDPVVVEKSSIKSGSYYDMDMTKIAQEVGLELKDEEQEMLNDLRFLWPYAVEHSETIKFAIYKLSGPEDKKKDENKVKNLLKPIAAIVPMAAIGTSSSMLGGSALIGGSFLQEVLQGNTTPLQKHIEKVTDTDLVILAKSVEELQTKLVLTYYDYITAKKVLFMTDEIVKNRHKYYIQMQNSNERDLVIADTFYRDSIQKQTKAREDFLIKRSSLEQIVGNEAIVLLEQNKQEAKKDKGKNTSSSKNDEKKENAKLQKQEKDKSPDVSKSLKEQEKEFKKLKQSKNKTQSQKTNEKELNTKNKVKTEFPTPEQLKK